MDELKRRHMDEAITQRRTVFSPDRLHRFTLWRQCDMMFGTRNLVQFIGLNPSTADECVNDNTIRRCISFATKWGFKEMAMTNLFAFRATEPPDMMKAADPVGDDNILWIGAAARASELIICCWGNDGVFKKQCREVFKAALDWEKPLFHLGLTKEGQPLHPLYLKGSTEPRQFYQEASR